ncbi:MAG: hypothetical protein LBF92_07290, partial [Synergistaceae bacterium]|nr:hypothetical protein [Synergistaceae bacterium]
DKMIYTKVDPGLANTGEKLWTFSMTRGEFERLHGVYRNGRDDSVATPQGAGRLYISDDNRSNS